MIDLEAEIFTQAAKALRVKFLGINVTGEIVAAPADFPHVSIVETDNSVYERTQDSGSMENHAALLYEVNVYSNKKTGKKTECKAIFAELDRVFSELGFTRMMLNPIQNADPGIYRMISRYRAVVSKEKIIYRR